MHRFTAKYADRLAGVLSGFDRLLFRGTLRRLSYVAGLQGHLAGNGILLKHFADHARTVSERIKKTCLAQAAAAGMPVKYLDSPAISKEDLARELARERGVTTGPVCLLTCVEPCQSFDIFRNKETKQIELVSRARKCLSYYWYEVHPECGFLHVRLRTWFPFDLQVCLNGREWLARQLGAAHLAYVRHDNCFSHVEDFGKAQALLDAQLCTDWPALLNDLALRVNPRWAEFFGDSCPSYYWTTPQSEWATDVVFRDPDDLRRSYPRLVHHAMTTLHSADVLRFLGRRLPPGERIPGTIQAEVTSGMKERPEGIRVKHQVNGNSVKAYDKAYTATAGVLRAETTLNNVHDIKVYRPKEGGAADEKEWRPLRKGIADLHRRAQVSQAANDRYLTALASVDEGATLEERVRPVTQPTTWKGKRVRALQPFAPGDMALLEAVSRGEFAILGMRNRDLRRVLCGDEQDLPAEEVRRRASRMTRQIRMLRAHGLLQKVSGTHRYQVTAKGREILTAILSARHTPVSLLVKAA